MMVVFVYVLCAVLFGSILGWALAPWIDYEYEKILTRGVLIALAVGLVPLGRHFSWRADELGFEPLALNRSTGVYLLRAFCLGMLVITPPILFFLVVGFRVIDPRVEWGDTSLWGVFLWILVSAWLVAIFEETLFRGVLLAGLLRKFRRRHGVLLAVCLSSTCYALVHFLRAPEFAPEVHTEIFWYTGVEYAISGFSELLAPQAYWDSFLALALLGGLLCILRMRYGLWCCIALHASWVFMIRLFKEATVRDIVNPYIDWVGTYDHFVGHLVSLWLLFIFLLLHLNDRRQQQLGAD